MDKLLNARSQIDKIDDQIMELLDERYSLSIQIGKIKQETKSPVLDSNREQIVLDKTSKLKHSHTIRNVYKSIMDESKKLQGK